MKKWVLAFLLLIIVIVTGILFIPASKPINLDITSGCTENGAARIMLNKENFSSWWPGKKTGENTYSFKDCDYRIDKIMANGIEATIFNNTDSTKGSLLLIAAGNDSIQFNWTSTFYFSNNLGKKVLQYGHYAGLKKNIDSFMAAIKKYFDDEKNIYGIHVEQQKVTESSMIATKQSFNHYPTVQEVYGMINEIKEYIREQGGEQYNFPMLNVHTEDSVTYDAMVAIPTKTDLPSHEKFSLKKMVLGNILVAEVKGGNYAIIEGEQQLKNYVNDHKKIAPAIPFQSLVTDRMAEPDTAKWITRLYYPIFH